MDEKEKFVIDDDAKAEWALGKIRDAQKDRDRLLKLAEQKQKEIDEFKDRVQKNYESETSYLQYLLNQYMEKVGCHYTLSQKSYQLFSGRLVKKFSTVDFKKDKDELLAWLKTNASDYVRQKVTEEPAWAALKKDLIFDAESGICILKGTGEVVQGVTAYNTEEKFDIQFVGKEEDNREYY